MDDDLQILTGEDLLAGRFRVREVPPEHAPVKLWFDRAEITLPVFWVGQQWVVSDFGVECLTHHYWVEKARLWQDEPDYSWRQHMAVKPWVDRDDFNAALEFAQNHFAALKPARLRGK